MLQSFNHYLKAFYSGSFQWMIARDMPREKIDDFVVVMLKDRYLVLLGGFDRETGDHCVGCFIYDCFSNL